LVACLPSIVSPKANAPFHLAMEALAFALATVPESREPEKLFSVKNATTLTQSPVLKLNIKGVTNGGEMRDTSMEGKKNDTWHILSCCLVFLLCFVYRFRPHVKYKKMNRVDPSVGLPSLSSQRKFSFP